MLLIPRPSRAAPDGRRAARRRRGGLAVLRGAVVAVLLLHVGGRGVGVSAVGAENRVAEFTLKSTFLYKFVRATEWPEPEPPVPTAPLVVAVFGGEAFRDEARRVLEGESLHGRPLEVRLARRPEELTGATVVYVGRDEARRQREVLEFLGRAPVLTVGESEGFCRAGGMINLKLVRDQVRFEINPDALKRSGLRLSSQVMKLAEIVRDNRE